jgi:hypothetical protein
LLLQLHQGERMHVMEDFFEYIASHCGGQLPDAAVDSHYSEQPSYHVLDSTKFICCIYPRCTSFRSTGAPAGTPFFATFSFSRIAEEASAFINAAGKKSFF